ncbi:bifunctional folylpolyglutamate synthase/dihydrofolate synthase Ecym_6102 [Eremothecium cymbalariae DBVPG|uniref:Dihydrofolate synthetase n=1 Tax=Eremothecium cymbalariae (strain CBS 270.75 / DBVPG 7215 / KCTC 17166 / NRRL Y-17582) TaxID=931890 RepID=G8JV18_ERECY|nr:hypothetical protein Ecym_6102 [Eremothecium cymbalariae DBVPG\
MSIDLRLSRIRNLLRVVNNPHYGLKYLHITGTNGKGSVCSYLASVLQKQAARPLVGKFTSPHLAYVNESITVNDVPISDDDFRSIKQDLLTSDRFSCSEFEILACIAFKYFQKRRVDWCVLEVGVGGQLDATNVVQGRDKICGITKISLDHEGLLGSGLTSIAAVKSGIVSEGVEFTAVDGTNDGEAVAVIRRRCDEIGSQLKLASCKPNGLIETDSWGLVNTQNLPLNGEYQVQNLSVALSMLDYLQKCQKISINTDQLMAGIASVRWPARLHHTQLKYSKDDGALPVLMDGAHNASAAVELEKYLTKHYRTGGQGRLVFIIAVSEGKTLDTLLKPIIHKQDRVVVPSFGPVEGSPWVHPVNPVSLAEAVKQYTDSVIVKEDPAEAVKYVAQVYPQEKVVICGSLYLCGHLIRNHDSNMSASSSDN